MMNLNAVWLIAIAALVCVAIVYSFVTNWDDEE